MSTTSIVDIQDTNPQVENFDTGGSIDVDQEGFIEASLNITITDESYENNNYDDSDHQLADNDDNMDGVEMAPLVAKSVDNSADHGIPTRALIEAMHPDEQHFRHKRQQQHLIDAAAEEEASLSHSGERAVGAHGGGDLSVES
jgi:hypothetical protein